MIGSVHSEPFRNIPKCPGFSEFHGNQKSIMRKRKKKKTKQQKKKRLHNSKLLCSHISLFYGEAAVSDPGSFAVQFGNHLRACTKRTWKSVAPKA